jgi:hypothetical protein
MRERRQKCIEDFNDNTRTLNERATFNTRGKLENSSLLKCLVRNEVMRVCIVFLWYKIEFNGGLS